MAQYRGESPEHIAETIIGQPIVHVPNTRGWRKRIPRTHVSQGGRYWIKDLPQFDAKPLIDGRLYAAPIKYGFGKRKAHARPDNPLPYFVDKPKMVGGLYGNDQFFADVTRLELERSELRTNFLAGQGPYTDGLKFKAKDDTLLAEIKACEFKLRATQGIIQKSKAAAKLKIPTSGQAESKGWKSIGNEPLVARNFEQMGFKVRKIEAGRVSNHHYQVLMTRR